MIRIAIGIAAALLLLLLVLAMMPWGAFKGRAERALTAQIGAPVTIGAIERRGLFSFAPLLDIRDL
ncbi:MAG: AsmA family protein, partial [Sphingomonadales bacterium]